MKIDENRIFYHVAIKKLLDDIEYYLGLGINFEIYVTSDFIDNHRPGQVDLINRQFREKNILKRIHGPFLDLAPASTDIKIRDLSKQRMLSGIDICRSLECSNIVFHSHYDPVYHRRHFDEWKANSKNVWKEICDYSKSSGVTVGIENSEDDNPGAILHLIKEYPDFKACFDIAHYTIFGTMGWRDIFKRYPQYSINELHLSDNNTMEDQHLVLGEGSVEIKELLSQASVLDNNIAITIEPHSKEEMVKDIVYMRNFSW